MSLFVFHSSPDLPFKPKPGVRCDRIGGDGVGNKNWRVAKVRPATSFADPVWPRPPSVAMATRGQGSLDQLPTCWSF